MSTAELIPGTSVAADIRQSEMAVAGAAICSVTVAEALSEVVLPEHFSDGRSATVYGAALALAGRGDPVDPIAVLAELRRTGSLALAGGGNHVHDCQALGVPNPRWHAERVAADSHRRRATQALLSAETMLADPGFDPETGYDQIRQVLDAALAPPGTQRGRTIQEIVVEAVRRIEEGVTRGIETPWWELNDAITGLAPGEMIIVAARPSIGKSIVGGQIASYAALTLGIPSLLVSMEMSAEEITMRLIASEARVPLTTMLRAEVKDERDWSRICDAAARISASPLVIDDASDCSLAHLRSRLREMSRTGVRLLVVDYLGLMTAPKAENRQNAVAILSRELKKIAREFGIPVVVLAQLNRAPEQRPDKRPNKADLRDSGAQEQDADMVLLLHQADDEPGVLEVHVAKQRQGPRDLIVKLSFQGHYARCMDLAKGM